MPWNIHVNPPTGIGRPNSDMGFSNSAKRSPTKYLVDAKPPNFLLSNGVERTLTMSTTGSHIRLQLEDSQSGTDLTP